MTAARSPHRLACSPNFRDVADTVPGLRRGLLYRSDLVVDPDARDAAEIRGCGIRLVIDLRGPHELERRPNRWFAEEGVEIAAFDVNAGGDPARLAAALAGRTDAAAADALMVASYADFAGGSLPALGTLGERIAAGDLPVLVHCAAGKDRTGFVIAALLRAVGIDPVDVEADYLASAGRLHVRTIHDASPTLHRIADGMDEAALLRLRGTSADYLRAAIAAAEALHGSFAAFLRAAGFDAERVAAIRDRLLIDPDIFDAAAPQPASLV